MELDDLRETEIIAVLDSETEVVLDSWDVEDFEEHMEASLAPYRAQLEDGDVQLAVFRGHAFGDALFTDTEITWYDEDYTEDGGEA